MRQRRGMHQIEEEEMGGGKGREDEGMLVGMR